MQENNYSKGLLQKRLLVVLMLITFLFMLIIVRIGIVQVVNGAHLQVLAIDQWTRDVPLKAMRGAIYDTNGNIIAKSNLCYDVYVRHKNVDDEATLALNLSEILNIPFEDAFAKVSSKLVSETVIKLQASENEVNKIKQKQLQGVVISQNFLRFYPYGDLFTQVLGFTTRDGIGQFGLEAQYNEILKGINGKILTQSDVKGVKVENSQDYYIKSIDGLNVTTTLDHAIQALLEDALTICMQEQNATKTMGIVMNAKTGEVLAMSCKPSFNLNEVPRDNVQSLLEMSKNMLITDIYEPGSTFKILTSAVSLDEGIVTVGENFYDPGYRVVSGEKIKCWKLVGHGSQTFEDGFCNSCNSVFIDLALRLGLDKFYERMQGFGLGQKTDIDFQGEVAGMLMDKKNVKTVDLARMGFGQAIAVSPIQLITALCATVNGGELLQPYIVKEIVDASGKVLEKQEKQVKSKVIKPEVSSIIRGFLEEAVSRPLGKYTFLPGYCVGGKTGTTQKYANGALSGTYIASFFGIYPANDPDIAILFIVDEPKGSSYYGSIAASPYAKKVIEGIINLRGDKKVNTDIEVAVVEMPMLIGLSLNEANHKLKMLNLSYEIVGEGGIVVDQFPLAGQQVNANQVVQISLR